MELNVHIPLEGLESGFRGTVLRQVSSAGSNQRRDCYKGIHNYTAGVAHLKPS